MIRSLILSAALLFVPTTSQAKPLVIGDSLAVGMEGHLNAQFDAVVGRPLSVGVNRIKLYPRHKVLAFSLFTNDDPRNVQQLKRAVLYSRRKAGCVVWATIYRAPVGGVSYARANQALRTYARTLKRVELVDWAKVASKYVSAGDVHPGLQGYLKRASMYRSAIKRCERNNA